MIIKLLNEYKPKLKIVSYDSESLSFLSSLDLPGFTGYHRAIVFSKDFGFIKWLFDTHKISREAYGKVIDRVDPLKDYTSIYPYELVHIILAIHDVPNEFLESILKEDEKNTI